MGYAIPDVTPLPADPMYAAWNADTNRLGNFDILYLYDDRQLSRVYAVAREDGRYDIFSTDGTLVGYTYETNQHGYLVLSQAG
jgi:hypothetical protein